MGGGGCCIGDCGFCCVADCGFCCIMDFGSSSSCCVGYNSGPNQTESHAKKIANELAKMKEKKKDEWSKTEKEIVATITNRMDEYLKGIEGINQQKYAGKNLNIDLIGIQNRITSLKNEVIGFVGNVFEERLVLTDSELSLIMAEKNDKKRTKNFDNFIKKIQCDAVKKLRTKVQQSLNKQIGVICDAINSRMNEINTSMDNCTKDYEKLLEAKQNNENALKLQIPHIFVRGLCDVFLEKVNSK